MKISVKIREVPACHNFFLVLTENYFAFTEDVELQDHIRKICQLFAHTLVS